MGKTHSVDRARSKLSQGLQVLWSRIAEMTVEAVMWIGLVPMLHDSVPLTLGQDARG